MNDKFIWGWFFLFLFFLPTLGYSQEIHCVNNLFPDLEGKPLFCFELEFSGMVDNGAINLIGLSHSKKYRFNSEGQVMGWTENRIDFNNNQTPRTYAYFETAVSYDAEMRPKELVQYDSERTVVYTETFTYAPEVDTFTSVVSYNNALFFRSINCTENSIVEKNEKGLFTNIYRYPSPGREERSVFFERDALEEVVFTTITRNGRTDEQGNIIEFTRRDLQGRSVRVVHRHFIYEESELTGSRSIEALIDRYVQAFREGSFESLLEEAYLFRDEALVLNAPYLGKKDFPGQQWVAHANEKEAKAKGKEYLMGIRNRKGLNWAKLQLEKVEDKEVMEGIHGIGPGIYYGKCKIRMTDGERGFTTYLQFLKVNDRWYIYQEK